MIIYKIKDILWLYGEKNDKSYLIPFIFNKRKDFVRIIKERNCVDIKIENFDENNIETLFIKTFGLQNIQIYDTQTLYLLRLQLAPSIFLTKEEKLLVTIQNNKRTINHAILDKFIDCTKMKAAGIIVQTIRFKKAIKKAKQIMTNTKTEIDEKEFIF